MPCPMLLSPCHLPSHHHHTTGIPGTPQLPTQPTLPTKNQCRVVPPALLPYPVTHPLTWLPPFHLPLHLLTYGVCAHPLPCHPRTLTCHPPSMYNAPNVPPTPHATLHADHLPAPQASWGHLTSHTCALRLLRYSPLAWSHVTPYADCPHRCSPPGSINGYIHTYNFCKGKLRSDYFGSRFYVVLQIGGCA